MLSFILYRKTLFSLEEKWIKNQISKDTYDRWYSSYNGSVITLNGAIDRLSKDKNQAFQYLKKYLNMLTDMKYVYAEADTIEKREFIGLVFDNNLYY
ncbi:hypothetical protein QN352_10245 [Mucilaginibacter sp. 10I4]|nr:hypothetical protein [Mucilaginibacter sp. 10I4]